MGQGLNGRVRAGVWGSGASRSEVLLFQRLQKAHWGKGFMLAIRLGARAMAQGVVWGKRRHHMGQGGKGGARVG